MSLFVKRFLSLGAPTKRSPALWGKEKGICVVQLSASAGSGTQQLSFDVVTRTGFEPMLTA